MTSHTATAPLLPWRTGLAYGALAAPLAFASLPLYVNLPYHYASVAGAPLAGLGAVLLATRAFDALIDPAIGRWVDRLLHRGVVCTAGAAALASLLMALGFGALWHPPFDSQDTTGLLGWLACSLLVCTLAYSVLAILHQAWGTRWGGEPAWRARVTAWREGASLTGVLLASMLPAWLGLDATTGFLALGLALGLTGLLRLKTPVPAQQPPQSVTGPAPSPWANAGFRRLLTIFMVNGVAAAIPATLLPFFVADRLQASELQPLLLLCFFGAAALGLPLWVKAVSRWVWHPAGGPACWPACWPLASHPGWAKATAWLLP